MLLQLVKMALVATVFCGLGFAQPQTLQVRAEQWLGLTHPDGGGYLFEVISAVYEPLGYQLNFEFCPWRRCMLDVINGEADIIVSIFDNEVGVGDKLIIPRYPINLEKIGAVFKRSKFPDWQGEQTLANKLVAQNRGYDLHLELGVPVQLQEVSQSSQSWHMLQAERVDFVLGGLTLLERWLNALSSGREDYQIELLYERAGYLGYTNNPRGRYLITLFEQHLPKLYQTGQITELQQRWQYPWPIPLE